LTGLNIGARQVEVNIRFQNSLSHVGLQKNVIEDPTRQFGREERIASKGDVPNRSGQCLDADGLPPKPMDTCVPLATKNQVRQPKKRVPGAYRGAGNDLDLSKSIMVGQELVDGFHRTRLEWALCPSSRQHDPNLLEIRKRIVARRGNRSRSPGC